MRYFYVLFLFLLLVACSSVKSKEIHVPFSVNNDSVPNLCPNGGICTLKILKNKGITTKLINDSTTSYDLTEDSSKMVVVYNYEKNLNQASYDGGLAEEIVFEVESKDYSKTLTDENLKEAKVFYRRSCACRGRAGLFVITKGKLEINNHNKKISFTFDFDSGGEPQVTKNLKVVDGKL